MVVSLASKSSKIHIYFNKFQMSKRKSLEGEFDQRYTFWAFRIWNTIAS